MLAITFLPLFALIVPCLVYAGDIYGTLRENSSPQPNLPFQVYDASNRRVAEGQTQSDGSFRFSLPDSGRFRLTVKTASANIFASPNPAQYDFDLVKQPNGSYSLVRR
jgi:hypothetical protein